MVSIYVNSTFEPEKGCFADCGKGNITWSYDISNNKKKLALDYDIGEVIVNNNQKLQVIYSFNLKSSCCSGFHLYEIYVLDDENQEVLYCGYKEHESKIYSFEEIKNEFLEI
jgi:hypothetical protein